MRDTQLLLLLLLTAGVACALADPIAGGLATPLFAWSSVPCFSTEPGRAVLEAATDLKELLGDIVEGVARPRTTGEPSSPLLDGAALEHGAPEVVLVMLGSELRTSDLRRKHVAPLQALVDGAASSIAMPFVMHPIEEAPLELKELRESLEARLPGQQLLTAGCGDGSSLLEVPQLLASTGAASVGAGPRVVLGCTAPLAGRSGVAAVEDELRQVKAAHDAAAALGKRQVTVYAVRPDAAGPGGEAARAEQRRRLMAAGVGVGPYATCDALCRTQVKWLEGMLALFIIIIASLSGMCCLGVLDTPTRFESPKDAARAE